MKQYKYQSTKNFGNDRGFSCTFRQPKANHSHCSKLHGYSLGFKFTFGANTLDDKNWVYDFGNTKWIKELLEKNFDHTWAVDKNDPWYDNICDFVAMTGIADLVILDGVGCEKFAEHVFNLVAPKVDRESESRVQLISVECYEHAANSAIYFGENNE